MSAPNADQGGAPSGGGMVMKVVIALAVLTVIPDLGLVHKHGHFSFEEIPAFQGVFALVGCVAFVALAVVFRKVLARDEAYYEESDEPEAHVVEDHDRV